MRLIACVLLLLCYGSSWGQAEDDDLEKAKTLFRETEQKQRALVDAAFDRKIKDASRDGNLDLTTTLKSEQARFKQSSDLPESTSMKSFGQKYVKAIEQAQDKLGVAYEKKIKTETRAGRIADAKRLQGELDRLGLAGDAGAPPAVNPAAANAGLVVTSAIWKQDGRFGAAGAQTQDVAAQLLKSLTEKMAFQPNQKTLSLLDGRPATKSVYLDMTVHGLSVRSQLAENSSIHLRAATPQELKLKGQKLGKTPVEAVSSIYQTQDGATRVDMTNVVMGTLVSGGLVNVKPPLFGELTFGKPKAVFILFRIGQDVLEIQAAEGTQISIMFE